MSRSNQIKVQPITDRTTVLTFGKYKGETIADLLECNPQYLVWLHNNNDYFELSAELLDEAEENSCNSQFQKDSDRFRRSTWKQIGDIGN